MSKKNIHILVVNPLWPRPGHSTLSANVVFFELIMALIKQHDVKVTFLKINKTGDLKPSDDEKKGIKSMVANGVQVLEPLQLPSIPPRRSKILRTLLPKLEDFYPEVMHKELVKKVVLSIGADVLFVPWAEWATALCCEIPILKFAYYGNPDAKQAFAMAKFDYMHGNSHIFKYLAQRRVYNRLEKFHLNVMSKYELLGDVADNDAQYYSRNGHSNAFYIQNVWIDRFPDWKEEQAKLIPKVPFIVGSIGSMAATANTHGFEVLGKRILPELSKIMGNQEYKVHIFGSGKMHNGVVSLFNRPEVKICGFVDDIDREMMSSKIFVCANNASAYKVVHTRYLHAWSLGCCVVAHKDAALSKPEMVHMKNCLIGETPEEMAHLIKLAISDSELRDKIAAEGYRTFKEYFTAEKVVPKILDRIRIYFSSHVR